LGCRSAEHEIPARPTNDTRQCRGGPPPRRLIPSISLLEETAALGWGARELNPPRPPRALRLARHPPRLAYLAAGGLLRRVNFKLQLPRTAEAAPRNRADDSEWSDDPR
jgi:hypothetical protein